MRPTPVSLLKIKPLPASAFPSVRLPPSASSTKLNRATAASTSTSKVSTADVTAELEKKIVDRQELGGNVRLSKHINNKDLYWKVSKPQRDVLKKLLREA